MAKLPGVTKILALLDKPKINEWAAKECADLAVSYERTAGFPRKDSEDFAEWIYGIHKQEQRAKRREGTEGHKALERWPIDGETGKHTDVLCQQVFGLIKEKTGLGPRLFSVELRFDNYQDWYCGISDLVCPDPPWVIDYKFKPSIEKVQAARGEWHALQLHANACGHGIPRANLAVIFASKNPDDWGEPGAVKWCRVPNDPMTLHSFLDLARFNQTHVERAGPYYEKWAEHYKALENEDVAA